MLLSFISIFESISGSDPDLLSYLKFLAWTGYKELMLDVYLFTIDLRLSRNRPF